jgi:hypothetical protein
VPRVVGRHGMIDKVAPTDLRQPTPLRGDQDGATTADAPADPRPRPREAVGCDSAEKNCCWKVAAETADKDSKLPRVLPIAEAAPRLAMAPSNMSEITWEFDDPYPQRLFVGQSRSRRARALQPGRHLVGYPYPRGGPRRQVPVPRLAACELPRLRTKLP